MNIVNYFKDTISELKKLTLPSRKEVYVTTATITVVITVFALVVMLADFVIAKIIGLIFGL
jgi:preprotein translocase SecE subunit